MAIYYKQDGVRFLYIFKQRKPDGSARPPVGWFFDNFAVTHNRGAIVEENAYYPYGLKIQGISAKAFAKGSNLYGYQGDFAEKEEESGWDEFGLRMYNAQIGRWAGVDPYDEFASPYIGIGSNPVNFIDEDGGSLGFWGASIGFATFSTAGYLFANNNIHDDNKQRRHFQSALIGLASGVLGAGLGYGIGASLAGQGPVFLNTAGFYSRLFGGSGHINGRFDPLNRGWAYVDVPPIWGSGALNFSSIPPEILNTFSDIASANLIIPRIPKSEPVQSSIPKFNPTTLGVPRINPCICIDINVQTFSQRNFSFSGNSPLGYSYIDADISNEQLSVINSFTTQLQAKMGSGGQLINGNLNHTIMFPGVNPVNNIPDLGSGYVSFDPSTHKRVDGPWKVGYGLRKVIGAGNTIAQNFRSQTLIMRNILRKRFGNFISGHTRIGNPSPRYRFSGTYLKLGGVKTVRRCSCGN